MYGTYGGVEYDLKIVVSCTTVEGMQQTSADPKYKEYRVPNNEQLKLIYGAVSSVNPHRRLYDGAQRVIRARMHHDLRTRRVRYPPREEVEAEVGEQARSEKDETERRRVRSRLVFWLWLVGESSDRTFPLHPVLVMSYHT